MFDCLRKLLKISGFGFALLGLTSLSIQAADAEAEVCWKNTYGRGVGVIPKFCNAGWTASLVGTCNNNCPAGWRDDGLFCKKPGGYSRGTLWFSKSNCDNANKAVGGCEWSWGAWYPKCKEGYVAHVATECSPVCPMGMADIGISCAKKTTVAMCPTTSERDAGLCYNRCGENMYGVGPVCWSNCPKSMPVDCGAMCGTTVSACVSAGMEMVYALGDAAVKISKAVATLGATIGADAAAQAAKAALIETLKKAAKEVAEKLAKKFGTLALSELKDVVAKELKKENPSMSIGLANSLAALATATEKFDYVGFLASVDPTGITKAALAFKKEICK